MAARRPRPVYLFSAPNVFPFTFSAQKTVTAALTDSATSSYDGLGRVYQSQHVLPNGTSTVDTTFDDAHSQAHRNEPLFQHLPILHTAAPQLSLTRWAAPLR